jgi:hypothetical protein
MKLLLRGFFDREVYVTIYGESSGRHLYERNGLEEGYGLNLLSVHEHTMVLRFLNGLPMNVQEIM